MIVAAGDLAGRGGDQAHKRERGDALARAAFADDAERFATLEVKRDIVDSVDDAILRLELDLQVTNFE